MLVAIPISLIGLQTVNDIRNRAAEKVVELEFSTDFSSNELTTVYKGIPYAQMLELSGSLSRYATISLGCDVSICGNMCPERPSTPPEGLSLAADGRTLYWENPSAPTNSSTWDIVVSATTPSSEDPDNLVCIVSSFTLTYSAEHPNFSPTCTLYPPAQPDTIPAGFASALKLEASDTDGGIARAIVNLSNEKGIVESKTWTAEDAPQSLYINKNSMPPLTFIAQDTGVYTYSTQVTDNDGATAECDIHGAPKINVVIPGENGSPVFKTDPYTQSSPGTSLNIGQSYTYTVEATDPESDAMDYFVLNNTGWLTFTVNSNKAGSFKGTFSGTPTAAGSYTAGIAFNDGAHNHYSTQLWVINVNYPENDIPVVKISLPPSGYTVENNQKMRIEWTATDHNLITSFNVYISTDPGNEATFVPLITGLSYNFNAYVWDVGATTPGHYYIVVRATDNQTPPATGTGISPSFGISVSTQETPKTQPVVTSHPTITNLYPSDKSEISKSTPFISADFTASDNMVIKENSVVVKLDDNDVTEKSTIEGEKAHSGSFMYKPSQPIGPGTHKVSVMFEDSSGQTASKTWTFIIYKKDEGADDGDAEDDTKNGEMITIFGFKIPRRIAIIVGVGVVLLIIALLIPWFFYAAWRSSQSEDDDQYFFAEPSSRNWRMTMGTSPKSTPPNQNIVPAVPDTPVISPVKSPVLEEEKDFLNNITEPERTPLTPEIPHTLQEPSETNIFEIPVKQVHELKPEALIELPPREEIIATVDKNEESPVEKERINTAPPPVEDKESSPVETPSEEPIPISDPAGIQRKPSEQSSKIDDENSLEELQKALKQIAEDDKISSPFFDSPSEKPEEPRPVADTKPSIPTKPPIGPSDLH